MRSGQQPLGSDVRITRTSTVVPFITPETDDVALRQREVEALRVEYRRVQGRINFRRRRGRMFVALLVLTVAAALTTAVFMLSPNDWLGSQKSRFTQMTSLLLVMVVSAPLGAYFARRYDRQRERVRIASTRQSEILARLAQLDEMGGRRRRRRRRKSRRWSWRISTPGTFSRPPLESMPVEEIEQTADQLGEQLSEEKTWRAIAYLHAGVTGTVTVIVAFVLVSTGPEFLSSYLSKGASAVQSGPDPLIFWLSLTLGLIVFGGLGSHRVSVLLRHARGYGDRLNAVERALWDARVLLRERREKVG